MVLYNVVCGDVNSLKSIKSGFSKDRVLAMKKDYSEYQLSEYDRYQILRSNRKTVMLDYFVNTVRFFPEARSFIIRVDRGNEYHMMQDYLDEYNEDEQKRRGVKFKPISEEEEQETRKHREAAEIENQNLRSAMQQKYKVDLDSYLADRERYHSNDPSRTVEPLINIFSGSQIELSYGEGILDFVYADFLTPLKPALEMYQMFAAFREEYQKKKAGTDAPVQKTTKKVYNRTQEIVEDFFAYASSFNTVKETAYASLYSAICPPKFAESFDLQKELIWYGEYLMALQKEYLELIEFCFDENFYPDALGTLYPSERFAIYRYYHNLPSRASRKETVTFSSRLMGGPEMPYGMSAQALVQRFRNRPEPTADHAALAEKLGISVETLIGAITVPHFLNVQYQFGAVANILELEFTKMLEANVRFRKCKRCGKYFIMKGNYDTNYCDRVAEGETRNCQELAAAENYKARIADNQAIPIYNKYYKRYAARVRVKQIKEDAFKKWKYQAIALRDDCADGKITVEEYIQWMEDSFPNRKPKT